MKQTLFQVCLVLTISMFIFTLCVHYVSGLGIYGDTNIQGGLNPGDDVNETIKRATQSPDRPGGFNITTMWALVLTAAGAAGILVAWLTHSTAIIGVFVFSAAFWAAYINMLGILEIGNFLDPSFVFIGTATMSFVFIGAVAGMLSGSG